MYYITFDSLKLLRLNECYQLTIVKTMIKLRSAFRITAYFGNMITFDEMLDLGSIGQG